MTPLQALARARIDGIGAQQHGPYVRGRYDLATLQRMAREELADFVAYAAEFYLVENPDDLEGAALVAAAAENAWAALEAQARGLSRSA